MPCLQQCLNDGPEILDINRNYRLEILFSFGMPSYGEKLENGDQDHCRVMRPDPDYEHRKLRVEEHHK